MISKVSTLSFTTVESECNPQVKLELRKLKHDEQRATESEVYGGRREEEKIQTPWKTNK